MLNRWNSLKERLDIYDNLLEKGATKHQQAQPILELGNMAKHIGSWLLKKIHNSYRAAPGCRALFKKECETDTYHRVRGITTAQEELLDLFATFDPGEDQKNDTGFDWLMSLSYSLEKVYLLLQRSGTARPMITGRL